MSQVGRPQSFDTNSLSTPTVDARFKVGTRIEVDGVEYMYTQADDAITQYQGVILDAAASSTGKKVTPLGAAADCVIGAAQVAFTDEYYGWVATRGPVTINVANGTAAGDPLGGSAAAGVAAKVAEAGSGSYKFARLVALEANSSGGAAAKSAYLL